jgi:hypothetical protein
MPDPKLTPRVVLPRNQDPEALRLDGCPVLVDARLPFRDPESGDWIHAVRRGPRVFASDCLVRLLCGALTADSALAVAESLADEGR